MPRLRGYGPLGSPPAQLTVGCLTGVEPALQAPQACAFPRRQKAPVDQAGFEPAASGVWDRRSGLAELLIGAPGRIRTCTLLIRNQTPYPLGYRGLDRVAVWNPRPSACRADALLAS